MLKQSVLSVVLAVILASCAGSLPYAIDYPLTNQLLRSRDGIFTGKVPQGWFSSTDDTLAPLLTAWLVRNDFSATLAVKELILDHLTIRQVEKEGLKLLARLSLGFREDPARRNDDLHYTEFELSGRKFCSFELVDGGKRTRVVVFTAKGKYYECETMAVKGLWTASDFTKLFTMQQSFLSSMNF